MFKTIAASLLVLTLATPLVQAASIFDSGNGGSDSNPGDNFWDLPEPQAPIEINPHYQVPKRPTLDHYDPSLDLGLGPDKGKPVDYTKLAKLNVNLSLSCAVAGTPVEFPDDILIANSGLIEIPVGTQIVWQTKAPNLQGTTILAKTLKPGKSVKLNGVLAGGLSPYTKCVIKAIGA
jgi:hypothetical protein